MPETISIREVQEERQRWIDFDAKIARNDSWSSLFLGISIGIVIGTIIMHFLK